MISESELARTTDNATPKEEIKTEDDIRISLVSQSWQGLPIMQHLKKIKKGGRFKSSNFLSLTNQKSPKNFKEKLN